MWQHYYYWYSHRFTSLLTPLYSRTLYSPCNYRARVTNCTDCSVPFRRSFAKNTGLHRDRGATGAFSALQRPY